MKPKGRGPDPEIVARAQRAQAGDEQAFSELFKQLQAPVLNYAHQILSDRSSAEDVTQDAFLIAHQRLDTLGPPYDFKSWVYRIAGNLAIDQIRKDRRLVDLEDADVRGEPPTTRRPPERQVRRGEQQRMIRRSLDRLPPAYRQALVLREVHELSYDELARALDCSYDSARQLVHRARLRFREEHGLRLRMAEASERCTVLGGLLSAYQDGELTSEAEGEVRQHLAGCPHCRTQQEDLRAVGALLAIVPPLLPSPQWTQYVLQQLRKRATPGGGGKVNARMVEQPHAHAADLPETGGRSGAGNGASEASEPSSGRGGGVDAGGTGVGGVPVAPVGRWLAFGLFGAAAALGILALGFLAWRAPWNLLASATREATAPVAGNPISAGTWTPGVTQTSDPGTAITPPTYLAPETGTPTLTPTIGVPVATATQNANCRLGPGSAYQNVATLLEGQSADLEGRNAESSWWWIGTPGAFGGHCWVWGGSLSIAGDTAGLPVIAAPPTDTPVPVDQLPPSVALSYGPSGSGRPTEQDKITLSVNASDAGGIARIEIWFRAPNQSQASLMRTCTATTACSCSGGPYPAGPAEAFARAWDGAGNAGDSGQVVFTVLVYLQ